MNAPLVLLVNISHIPVRKIYFPIFKECARFTLTTKRDKKQWLWSREWYVYQQQLYSRDHTTRNISYPKKGTRALHQLTDFFLILTLAQSWDKVKEIVMIIIIIIIIHSFIYIAKISTKNVFQCTGKIQIKYTRIRISFFLI